jgi:FixJ family two-component response regulator
MFASPLNKSPGELEANRPQPDAGDAPTVFIVDDDVSFRESLEAMIGAAGWRPQAFASAQAFLSHSRVEGPGCLILDVNMPGLSGLELQALIADDQVGMPIIFVTGYGDVPMTVRAMKAGAAEFLTKPFDRDVLLAAVRDAIGRSRAAAGQEEEIRALRARHASLTPREIQVMAMVVSGLLNKQVGGELGISEITVKAHRGRMMRKMRATTFAELVNMGARLGVTAATPV